MPMQYNDKVDVVSSQHAAYNTQQKALGKDNFIAIPPGVSPAIIIIITSLSSLLYSSLKPS